MRDPRRISWSNDAVGMLNSKIIPSRNNAVRMLDPRRMSWGKMLQGCCSQGNILGE